jgi:hypothetical protein
MPVYRKAYPDPMRTYTLEVLIREGCDEFWEASRARAPGPWSKRSGSCLADHGFFAPENTGQAGRAHPAAADMPLAPLMTIV